METKKAITAHSDIISHIENREIKDALDKLKQMSSGIQNWDINEKIIQFETNYKYMIHYLVEGNVDPDREHVFNHLVREILSVADDLLEEVQIEESAQFFFEKSRLNKLRPVLSLDDFQTVFLQHADSLSVIGLMPEGEERNHRLKQKKNELENNIRDLFYAVFTSPRAHNGLIEMYKSFIENSQISDSVKSMFISALTMNILQRFDQKKIDFLLNVSNHQESETALRAMVGIVAIFRKYRNRWSYFSQLNSKIAVMSDDPIFTKRLMTVLIQYIQAHETEKITKKLTEEIIPEMMKLSPMIGKKINLDEWMGEGNFDEKNPEWQKILEDSDLSDKLQKFSEMQLGGADVFHSTFSNLKSYPFFNEMSNWFLPFDKNHSTLMGMFSDQSEGDTLLASMLGTSMICNSDKYSFCFSIRAMPEQYRKMMISQLGAESDELKKMAEEEQVLNPGQKEETIVKQYIQDLYRFFKLYHRRKDFTDIFMPPLDYHKIEAFKPIVTRHQNLKKIALYYFEKNNFSEALEAYQMLSETPHADNETWQKIGYCHQMSGNINEALKAYQKAELTDENNTWLLRRIAACHRLLKHPESALQYYRRLDQIKPDDSNTQLNIGHCFLELKQYDEALNYFFKVDLMSSGNTRAWRSIAWCSFLSGKYDTAQRYYKKIINNNPNAHDYINAGHVELCLSNKKECITYYTLSVKSAGNFSKFKAMFDEDSSHLLNAGIDFSDIPLLLDKVKYDVSE